MTNQANVTDEGPEQARSQELDERTRLDLNIAEAETELKRYQRNARNRSFVTGGLSLAAVVVIYTIATTMLTDSILGKPLFAIAVSLGYAALFLVSNWFTTQSRISSMQAEIDLLHTRRHILFQMPMSSEKTSEATPSSYFDSLVRINVENLAAYYNLVKVHTDNSFRVSIVAGAIGFLLIITGLAMSFVNNSNTQNIAYISTGTGVVIEFISGVFFYLYNRTVIRLKDYHDSLLAVQNILLSFKIVGDTQDEKEKVKMVSQMLVFLIGKQGLTGQAPNTDT